MPRPLTFRQFILDEEETRRRKSDPVYGQTAKSAYKETMATIDLDDVRLVEEGRLHPASYEGGRCDFSPPGALARIHLRDGIVLTSAEHDRKTFAALVWGSQ